MTSLGVSSSYGSLKTAASSNSGIYQHGSPWPHHRGIFNNNTGVSPLHGPYSASLAWKFPLNSPILSSPTIDANSHLYIGSQDYYIYALSSSGSMLWKFATGTSISSNFVGVVSSPAIAADGTLYVGASDGYLYAIDSTSGSLIDAYPTSGGISSSPSIGSNGYIYFGSEDGCVYAIRAGSSGYLITVWSGCTFYVSSYTLSPISYSSPAFSASGAVMYIGSQDVYLYALDAATGSLVWGFPTSAEILSTPAVGADGTVYVGSLDNCTYAILPSGSLKWKFRSRGNIVASPSVGADGTVYIGSQDQNFYALSGVTGSVKWSFSMGGRIQSSAVVDASGTLYVGSENDNLYALSSAGTIVWSFGTAGMTVSSPVIGTGGALYVGSDDNYLYSFINAPSARPTTSPSRSSTRSPSSSPTRFLSFSPTRLPSVSPTRLPSAGPTTLPSYSPSLPTGVPTLLPSWTPTLQPSYGSTSAAPLMSSYPSAGATARPSWSQQPKLLTAGNANKGSSFSQLAPGAQAGIILVIILAILALLLLIAYAVYKNRRRERVALDKWILGSGHKDDIVVYRDNYQQDNINMKGGFYVVSPMVDDGRESPTSSVSSVVKPAGMSLSPNSNYDDHSGGWRHSIDSGSQGRI